jgi:predicted transposase/invertase (TIGR01784 family)
MTQNDEDSAWKQILDAYLKNFIDYCCPKVSKKIDWSHAWTSLDKELDTIVRGNVMGKYICDKLFKVKLKKGGEQWILIHIEVQGKQQDIFAERMFKYAYRIYDKYQKAILSLAVLTDSSPHWRPASFKIGLQNFSYLKSKFMILKILDYQDKQAQLNASTNPFSSIILSQLIAIESKNESPRQRMLVKVSLVKRLYSLGLSREDVLNLLVFIDWLIGLPQDLELEYKDEICKVEEEKSMAYVTTFERFAREEGVQQGMQQGVQQGIAQGRELGKLETLKKLIPLLLKKGFTEKEILAETGLTSGEIEALKETEEVF